MASSLSIGVFNSGYKPIPAGPGWDDSTPATWPASTSTLISGDRDAILVDALLTTSEGQQLAAWGGTGRDIGTDRLAPLSWQCSGAAGPWT
jgi:hypothetical protein